jgi:hypothetical protein
MTPEPTKKKRGGRKKGVPNKQTKEVKAIAQGLILDPAYQRQLKTRLRDNTLPQEIEKLLWYYAFGKPAQSVNLTATVDLDDWFRQLDAERGGS